MTERLLEYHFRSNSTNVNALTSQAYNNDKRASCLWFVGSIMHMVKRANDTLWGIGILRWGGNINVTSLQQSEKYAVRGPRTLALMQEHGIVEKQQELPYGDPGMLFKFLYPEYVYNAHKAKLSYCTIPHKNDRSS